MFGNEDAGISVVGTMDAAKEREKISYEIQDTERYIASQKQKLENQEFVSKAPAQVVDSMRKKMEEALRSFQKARAIE